MNNYGLSTTLNDYELVIIRDYYESHPDEANIYNEKYKHYDI